MNAMPISSPPLLQFSPGVVETHLIASQTCPPHSPSLIRATFTALKLTSTACCLLEEVRMLCSFRHAVRQPTRALRQFSWTCRRLQAEVLNAEVDSAGLTPTERIRNIAIIAHVDHGKTTLVDQLLRQSGTIKQLSATEQLLYTPTSSSGSAASGSSMTADAQIEDGFVTRVMDSNDLERERGITILSKCTSVNYNGNLINIVDTPGHADFGGEVERIMSMVDGVALVVDATEGPMTQTRFVLSKALARGLRPLVVLNKADRPTSRPAQVESDLFDLFATLGATDEQADYPLLYASAKQGWAQPTLPPPSLEQPSSPSMTPLFNLIMSHVPAPRQLTRSAPFTMLTVQIEADPYVGILYLGRIHSGVLRIGDTLHALNAAGQKVGEGKVKKIYGRRGLERIERDSAGAGEIVSIAAGVKINVAGQGGVNLTLVHPDGWGSQGPQALPTTPNRPSNHQYRNPRERLTACWQGGDEAHLAAHP
ncbi:unnamed protein product [Cyclocybe aegerita]|uniref:Tr-type G domain-containing protein n=1 Tax=Cyclocybe aegerita TaxID=1973307 RepID=A0A8S0WZ72_CYCAE|nr:unnamed protein product [Cyclocybe aegerita]